jgi:hypothetical protein
MATRFYMSADSFSTVSFSSIGTWGTTLSDHEKLFMYTSNPGDMGFVLESYSHGSGTKKFRTFVSEGLAASINMNNATFTVVFRIGESSSSANVFQLFTVGIINSSGVVQVSHTEKDGTEAVVNTGTPSSRTNTASTTWTYTTSLNDRLVFEIGWDQDGAGTYTTVASRGNTSGTDLSSTEGDTDIQNPWFETDKTITFGGAEPPPPATNEDYNCSVYIAAVLDELV